jgi:PHD/YefM family antitoxin component YafN of YafNO toxin-antitoxin module
MQTINISEAFEKLSDLSKRVIFEHEQIILTHEQGNMVLISMDEWESYKETMRLLKDRSALKALVESFEKREIATKPIKSVRGCLKKYADPELIAEEESAWTRAVKEKYDNL